MKNIIYIYFLISIVTLFSCQDEKPGKENDQKNQLKKAISKDSKSIISHLQLTYSIIKSRPSKELKNDSLKKVIDLWLQKNENASLNEMIDFNLELTSDLLDFSFEKCSSDQSTMIKNGKANCIGYSALFNSLMNYTLKETKLNKKYTCKHYVGKIYYAGQDIHSLVDDPFFKDHDLNVIRDNNNIVSVSVDPSLYEYLGVKRIKNRTDY